MSKTSDQCSKGRTRHLLALRVAMYARYAMFAGCALYYPYARYEYYA